MGKVGRMRSSSRPEANAPLTREQARAAYLAIQRELIGMYVDQCTRKTSNVSGPWQRVNEWVGEEQRRGRGWLGETLPVIDAGLSMFANWAAHMMLRFENCLFASTSHLVLFVTRMATLDSFRDSRTMHFNAQLWGRHATSKSFVLSLLRLMSIVGTTVSVGSESKQARTTDTHNNDVTELWDETPLAIMKSNAASGKDDEESSLKGRLTSCCVERRVHQSGGDASSKRGSRLVISEQIGTMFGAWNWEPSQVSSALYSRFAWLEFVDWHRPGRAAEDLVNVDRNMSAETQRLRNIFLRGQHGLQAGHLHVEKLIKLKALTEVTMISWNTIVRLFRTRLRNRYGLTIDTRTIERLTILARLMTITQALLLLWSSPGSPHYGTNFAVEQLGDLDALLHTSEEISYMALELLESQYAGKLNNDALLLREVQAMLSLPQANYTTGQPPTSMTRAAFGEFVYGATAGAPVGPNGMGAAWNAGARQVPQQAPGIVREPLDELLQQQGALARAVAAGAEPTTLVPADPRRYQYVFVPLMPRNLAARLSVSTTKTSTLKLDEAAVRLVIINMIKSPIMAHTYRYRETASGMASNLARAGARGPAASHGRGLLRVSGAWHATGLLPTLGHVRRWPRHEPRRRRARLLPAHWHARRQTHHHRPPSAQRPRAALVPHPDP